MRCLLLLLRVLFYCVILFSYVPKKIIYAHIFQKKYMPIYFKKNNNWYVEKKVLFSFYSTCAMYHVSALYIKAYRLI